MLEKARNLIKTLEESFLSLIPIVVIISILFGLQYTPMFPSVVIEPANFGIFLLCMVFLGLGTTLFSLGSESSMAKVGSYIGASITKKKKIFLIVFLAILLGMFITIAEPDLTVLGDLVGKFFNAWIFKIVVGVGVGLFLAFGLLRIIFQKSMKLWIILFHFIIFALACLFGRHGAIIEIAFDSSGVTAGPITIPFLLTFGASVASVRGGKNNNSDSFGVSGFCSIGPIITILLMFLFIQNSGAFADIKNTIDTDPSFVETLVSVLKECLFAILPIALIFLIYQLVFIRLKLKELGKIFLGFLCSYIGIAMFLIAANIGLIPIGFGLGKGIIDGGLNYSYILIIIALVIGISIVLVEPAIKVLAHQVEEVSTGTISKRALYIALALGVSTAIVLSVIRAIWGNDFSILYYYVPIYLLTIILSILVPDIYVGIGFDSGGVATGPMSSCFVLPLVIGIYASQNSADGSGFGVLGLIQILPTLMIEILGLISIIKSKRLNMVARRSLMEENDAQIIHF